MRNGCLRIRAAGSALLQFAVLVPAVPGTHQGTHLSSSISLMASSNVVGAISLRASSSVVAPARQQAVLLTLGALRREMLHRGKFIEVEQPLLYFNFEICKNSTVFGYTTSNLP
jgi:hypothetical protein